MFDVDNDAVRRRTKRATALSRSRIDGPCSIDAIRHLVDDGMVRFFDGNHLLLEADCMQVMAALPDRSVDAIITDPPYAERTHAKARTNRGGREGGSQSVHFNSLSEAELRAAFAEMGRLTRRWVVATVDYRHAVALEEVPPDGLRVLRIGVWCLSGGTWIWARTTKGDMPAMLKDLVRLDPSTIQLWNGTKWTRVLEWSPSHDTSENLRLTLRSGEEISCTGDHLWPTTRGNVRARELLVGDTILTCTIPEPDGAVTPAYLTDDVLWLIGLFLAEGSRANTALVLSLNADEAHWLPRIEAAVRHLGGTTGHTIHGSHLSVRIWGRVAHAAIETYIGGRDSKTIHLRNAAWALPNQSLRSIIEGYLDGDGHHDKRNSRWTLGFTRNRQLARDLRAAAARLGATITLRPSTATAIAGGRRYSTFHGEWRWTRSGHWNERDRGDVVAIRAWKGRQFWDVTVEDDPHLFALASGVLTHNCKINPMPQITGDRPGMGWEAIVFLHRDDIGSWWNGGGRSSVWRTSVVHGRHPTEKPVSMLCDWVRLFSEPGDVILDPFAGSGTTAVAAKAEGRRSVSIERDPQWMSHACDRLSQEVLV